MRKFLTTSDFFLSSVVERPSVFISHVWSSDAAVTAFALRLRAMVR